MKKYVIEVEEIAKVSYIVEAETAGEAEALFSQNITDYVAVDSEFLEWNHLKTRLLKDV